jgi:hypothetical protein
MLLCISETKKTIIIDANDRSLPILDAVFYHSSFCYAVSFQEPKITFIKFCRASKGASFDKKILVIKY